MIKNEIISYIHFECLLLLEINASAQFHVQRNTDHLFWHSQFQGVSGLCKSKE